VGEDAEALARTALHDQHVALGARMVPFAGYSMPVQYSSIKEEHRAVRERAGLFDVSHMGQIELRGTGAQAYLDRLLTCPIEGLTSGRARYGLMLDESGGCLDDVMLTRVDDLTWFLCVNASNVAKCREWIEGHRPNGVEVEDRSGETSLLALQGPGAAAVLTRLLDADHVLPKRFRVTPCGLAGVEVLASGTGYTGSPGFELYLRNSDAPRLWDAILEAGAPDGVQAAGLGARDTLRLEAALPLYGHELDETTSPFEAGLDRFVKPLETGFIGAQALARRAQEPDPRRLVGLEMRGRGIARADHEIVEQGVIIGRVTSGAPSPTLGTSIALGYVPRSRSAVGTALGVRIRGKDVEAVLVETPFLG
jgi:aminomethyltransferase